MKVVPLLQATSTAPLQQATDRFIAVWGQMAANWGISKTMAQVYALLYASAQPLDTDEIMHRLGISRGNANMNLHRLIAWGLVNKQMRAESRKAIFTAEKDVWNLTTQVIRERTEKEIKPVPQHLATIAASLDTGPQGQPRELAPAEVEFKQNLADMAEFLSLFNQLSEKMLPLLQPKNRGQLQVLLRLLNIRGKKHT